jgi:hypothetical protein
MANYEYYAVAREIEKKLNEEGFNNWSQKLEDAIISGATGTEIFMALRWNLNQIKREAKTISKETLSLIDDLFIHINAALK